MKVLATYSIKGGVGKTTIVYHLAWMLAERGLRVLAVDLDPQANLTIQSLGDDRIAALWRRNAPETISSALAPLLLEGEPANFAAVIAQPRLTFPAETSARYHSF